MVMVFILFNKLEKNSVKYSEAKRYPKEKHLAKPNVLNMSAYG